MFKIHRAIETPVRYQQFTGREVPESGARLREAFIDQKIGGITPFVRINDDLSPEDTLQRNENTVVRALQILADSRQIAFIWGQIKDKYDETKWFEIKRDNSWSNDGISIFLVDDKKVEIRKNAGTMSHDIPQILEVPVELIDKYGIELFEKTFDEISQSNPKTAFHYTLQMEGNEIRALKVVGSLSTGRFDHLVKETLIAHQMVTDELKLNTESTDRKIA